MLHPSDKEEGAGTCFRPEGGADAGERPGECPAGTAEPGLAGAVPAEEGHYSLPGAAGSAGGVAGPARGAAMPAPVSYAVLAVCVALFVLANALRLIPAQALVFSPGNGLVFPGLITHMFAHGSAMHLLGNMAVLFFLGTLVERRYGSGKYAALYFVSGLFAALAEGAVAPGGYLLGASGALAGVMAAFVRHYPRAMLFIYGVLPMPAWLFIVLWLGYNMWGASTGAAGGLQIAFAAHLAGFCAGMVLSLLLVPPRRHGARS